MSDLAAGESLDGRFTLVRPLGEGGTARVWLVRDEELGEPFVAKILPPGTPEERVALLRRECRNARRLLHPNIVRVHEFHRTGACAFIVMDPVEGDSSGKLRGRPPSNIVRTAIQVAEALQHAHEQGIVHRDLKAGNVLLDDEGTPHLADFGLAGVLGDDAGPVPTGGGTRHVVSPQQLDGSDPDPADDIYALGVLLYEWVTGYPPFWPEVTDERIRREVPPPMESSHGVPERLQSLVSSMLAKSPADRPADMRAVADELRAIARAGDGSSAPPANRPEVRLSPPPRIEPSRVEAPPAGRPRKRLVVRALVACVLVILGAALVLVFVYLPRWAEDMREHPDSPAATAAEAPATATIPETPAGIRPADPEARRRVEEALGRVGRLREALEARAAAEWAGEDWALALADLATADGHLAEGRYTEAETSYRQAAARLESLRERLPEVLGETLGAGQAALEAGDSERASEAFGLAARMDPGNAEAAAGTRRASVLDRVFALLAEGRRLERNEDLVGAEERYRRAAELDPASRDAREGLSRVVAGARERGFNRAVAEGLDALDRSDPEAARKAFRRAEAVVPGSREVAEGIARADRMEKLAAISAHREGALRLESEERWREAAELYAAVLELDPAVRFAQEGRERCEERAALRERMDHHIDQPDRLATVSVQGEASRLLDRVRQVEPMGPVHRSQIERLEALLEVWTVPVPVRLVSDGLTEVVVYRVGRLGAFDRHVLELRPGTYTVVGTRTGYRDVRRRLVVEPGRQGEPLVVVCEEEI